MLNSPSARLLRFPGSLSKPSYIFALIFDDDSTRGRQSQQQVEHLYDMERTVEQYGTWRHGQQITTRRRLVIFDILISVFRLVIKPSYTPFVSLKCCCAENKSLLRGDL